ncbi:hypothetical protein K9M47_02730 [Candidatus Gracilibacteria bacterium]|nr:hypothetical protein [Candidatus Gracilibacteria bacterium]MCF7898803.1 hypothetical protein [Candidatus Paceibacterota bacterium]
MASGRHNGSKKVRKVQQADQKPELGSVVQLYPLEQFQNQQKLTTFGQLKVGDRFQFPVTESSPKDMECPIHVKTEVGRKDESNPRSELFNCKVGPWKEWVQNVIPVIRCN